MASRAFVLTAPNGSYSATQLFGFAARSLLLINRAAVPVYVSLGGGVAAYRLAAAGEAGDTRELSFAPATAPTEIAVQGQGGTGDVTVEATEEQRSGVTLPTATLGAAPAAAVAGTAAFGAYRQLPQAIAAGGAAQIVAVDTESFDPDNVFTGASNEFTAPATGIYEFTATVLTDLAANGSASLGINGVPRREGPRSPGFGKTVNAILSLNLGDTVQVYFTDIAGAGLNIQGGEGTTYFCGVRLA